VLSFGSVSGRLTNWLDLFGADKRLRPLVS
jgi:hypothetical protein